ncbi:hypothetical protein [Parapedobacter luteus]|uniref:hypothetical protein n=1 Tax=Parapedobacter luteus TaxID=623280 RepID=UPI001116D9B7|nr:hypothetical protein [Parapedobacter luteus]
MALEEDLLSGSALSRRAASKLILADCVNHHHFMCAPIKFDELNNPYPSQPTVPPASGLLIPTNTLEEPRSFSV